MRPFGCKKRIQLFNPFLKYSWLYVDEYKSAGKTDQLPISCVFDCPFLVASDSLFRSISFVVRLCLNPHAIRSKISQTGRVIYI